MAALPASWLLLAPCVPAPWITMAHRLRFHFGSGRSNTAPESEILDQEREEDFFMAFHTLPRRSSPHPCSPHGTGPGGGGGGGGGPQDGVGALKRSSSMFIPQLLTGLDSRPTRSSSVQISLQRKATTHGATDGCGPPEGPEDKDDDGDQATGAWASTQSSAQEPVQRDALGGSSPPTATGDSCSQINGHIGRSLRVPCCGDSVEEAGPGLRIQHRASSADVRQVRLLPLGPDGASEPRRWSLQHVPDASGSSGKRCFIFQLQQPQVGGLGPGGDFNFGFTGTKGNRLVRYPRIRLERSTSYPTQPRAGRGSPTEERATPEVAPTPPPPPPPPRASRVAPEIHRTNSAERIPQGQGCMFKIRQEPNIGQQHFRILVTRGPEEASAGAAEDGSIGAAVSAPRLSPSSVQRPEREPPQPEATSPSHPGARKYLVFRCASQGAHSVLEIQSKTHF